MKILIVGGGSAGWMTAATLESQLPQHEISLIESKNISTVGVGESTIQQIKGWIKLLNIDEDHFIKHVDGVYKLSIKFTDFYKKGESFHYPFGEPIVKGNQWWFKKILNEDVPNHDYADSVFPLQMQYVHQKKFNKEHSSYAYHFDATKFGLWLRDHYCKKVNHIIDDVVSIEQDENGIVSLNNKYKADLYIDCTGFKSLLLDKTLKEPFESYSDLLPNDSAWATKLQYTDKEKQLEPFTNCTAIENGWVWNIPLWSRIGTGYVYSSKFVDDDTALQQFKNHLGKEDLDFKKIKMRVGIHERLFVKNVVAIGLSAGFIEPLESNGLFSVHEFLIRLLRNTRRGQISQWDKDNFTYQCKLLFKEFAEFVAMHYALSHRNDTEYWKHCFNKSWDKSMINLKANEIVGLKQAAKNRIYDFTHDTRAGSHCIAAGMNWSPTDIPSLIIHNNHRNIEDLKKQYDPIIYELYKLKKQAYEKVSSEENLLSVLEKAHK